MLNQFSRTELLFGHEAMDKLAGARVAVFGIPAGVGLMVSWNTLRPLLIPVAIITVVTIITVMIVSGHTAQFVLKRQEKGGKKDAKSAD